MKKLQNTLEKATQYWHRAYAFGLSLRDPRRVGLLVFSLLVLMVTWSGAKAIQTNYTLQRQVYELQRTNEVKKLENANLAYTNDYYKTSQYLEITARQNLGLAAPGETVLLVPKDVALTHTVTPERSDDHSQDDATMPFWQRNFRAWMDFFLHRQ